MVGAGGGMNIYIMIYDIVGAMFFNPTRDILLFHFTDRQQVYRYPIFELMFYFRSS